jgi:hypothetical protein
VEVRNNPLDKCKAFMDASTLDESSLVFRHQMLELWASLLARILAMILAKL